MTMEANPTPTATTPDELQELQKAYVQMDRQIVRDLQALREHLQAYHDICVKVCNCNTELRRQLAATKKEAR